MKRQYLLFAGDLLVLVLAIAVSYALRIYLNTHTLTLTQMTAKFSPWLVLVILLHLLTLYLLDLYNLNKLIYRFRSSVMIVVSVVLAGLFIGSIFFFLPKYIFGRQVLLIHLVVASVLLVSWRISFHELLSTAESNKRLAFVGSPSLLEDFLGSLGRANNGGMEITCAVLKSATHESQFLRDKGINIYDSVDELLAEGLFDILIVDVLGRPYDHEEITRIVQVKFNNKAVYDLPTFFKNIYGKIPLTYIDSAWILNQQSMQGQVSKPYIRCKRIVDIFGSLILMIVFFPLFFLIALAIKIESRGPVIFVQERLGLNRVPFNCLKFRTMIDNAEKAIGPTWSSEEDPRITKVGKFLRRTRLDELPQLLNILKGDISFVGPRPIREHFAKMLSEQIPYYDLRYSVQPGLSGWAQIHKCYAVPDGYKSLEYELFYIQNVSLFIDLLVIFKTIKTVLMGHGK